MCSLPARNPDPGERFLHAFLEPRIPVTQSHRIVVMVSRCNISVMAP